MASDYLAFQKPTWPIRDWFSKLELLKYFWYQTETDLPPGSSISDVIYTVPSGKILYYTDAYIETDFRGWFSLMVPNVVVLLMAKIEAFTPFFESFSIPIPIGSGENIGGTMQNLDIVSGRGGIGFISWETPASEPEKPKSDDPIELYRCGEFNYCQVIPLPNGEQLFLFGKTREGIRHYLRIKDYSKPSQKLISQFHLKPEEPQEIIEIFRQKPEKLIETLKKYEEKYKPKKFFGL
jgi:hypothetical protein